MSEVSPEERDRARASAYHLFARLLRREPTTDLLATLAELPGLGDALPSPFEPDEAAAEHHRVLVLQVPPWAGVFMDPEGRIGGASAALVRALYARAGLELDERSEEADHLGHALDLLAELGARPRLAAAALDGALLPWLPWWVEAIARSGGPFHRALAELTLELALDHRAALPEPAAAAPGPPPDDPLADEGTGLARIAAFLVTPARSGLYLARDDVRRMASAEGLPVGFGGRADSLETALRAAAELGALDRVAIRLLALVEQGRGASAALAQAGGALVAAPIAARRARLDRTAALLATLREAAAAAG